MQIHIETCVMCGKDITKSKRTFTACLIFGNKSRDPHVGPYCENCGPPTQVRKIKCIENCPKTKEPLTPTSVCEKCDYFIGESPFTYDTISCKHPEWKKRKVAFYRGKMQ